MTRVCSCSSKVCEMFGCQEEARDRARLAPFAPMNIPPTNPTPGVPWLGATVPIQHTLTEADVRRIVREELARAKQDGERDHG